MPALAVDRVNGTGEFDLRSGLNCDPGLTFLCTLFARARVLRDRTIFTMKKKLAVEVAFRLGATVSLRAHVRDMRNGGCRVNRT